MWFLWILIVFFISSTSTITPTNPEKTRYKNQMGNQCVNEVRKFAFYTENGPGGYEITSLSGETISNVAGVDDSRVTSFDDEEFSLRAFKIGFPATSDIVIEMEVDAKKMESCFPTLDFQLPCLCYADNAKSPRYKAWEGGNVIYYCGKKQSMICFDYQRDAGVISSNPTILKNGFDFDKEKKFYKNVHPDLSGAIKITFTILKNTTNEVYFNIFGKESGSFEIVPFNVTYGYDDYDSTQLKVITVLPFQIFDPTCEIKWKFINGKFFEYTHPNIQFKASVDTKGVFISDKRTIFKKSKTKSSAAATITATTTMTFIGSFFFYTLFMYV